MKIFKHEVTARGIAKGAVKVVSYGVGACAACVVKSVAKGNLPQGKNKLENVIFGIGVGAIGSVISVKVLEHYEQEYTEWVDMLFDEIDSRKALKNGEPDVINDYGDDKQIVVFEDEETARVVQAELKRRVADKGFVSVWALLAIVDQPTTDPEAMTRGWCNLESSYIQKRDKEGQTVFDLVLPKLVEHEKVPELIERIDDEGNRSWKVHDYEIINEDSEGDNGSR